MPNFTNEDKELKSAIGEIDELTITLNYYNKKYDEGNPEINDMLYDMLYYKLEQLEKETGYSNPKSPIRKINYDVVTSLEKVKHSHLMLSLNKTKDIHKIEEFLGDSDWIAMHKLDGLSCSLTYENGELIMAETRGQDGIVGENILHNAKAIPSIPNHIPDKERMVIDGEIICYDHDFEKIKETTSYKNGRNYAAGSIRLKDANECRNRNLTFIAWDVIEGMNEITLSEKLEYLADMECFIVVDYYTNQEQSIEEAKENLITTSMTFSIPIDGIVYKFNDCEEYASKGRTDHHFKGGIALKLYDKTTSSKLINIEYSMGRTGVLTPVAIFEPIEIDGTTVSRASLHNYSVMKQLLGEKCYKGQKVEVIKANEIIPQITSSELIDEPTDKVRIDGWDKGVTCPCCGEPLKIEKTDAGIEFILCPNPKCSGKLVNVIDHYCGKKGLDIKGLSIKTIEKLINLGWLDSIVDIYKLKNYRTEWINQEGFGEKSVDAILNAIENTKENTELWQFICGLGIPMIGKTYSKVLAEFFKTWERFRAVVPVFDFTDLDGFGFELAAAIQKYDFTLADLIYEQGYCVPKKFEENDKPIKANVQGLTFVITGKLSKPRKDIQADIESCGGKVTNSVTKKTDYLVIDDPNSSTSKAVKARDLGTKIIDESMLYQLLDF